MSSQLKSEIENFIDTNMGRTLPEIASRIAMTRITDPACYFTTKTADGQPDKKQLFDTLSGIPRQPVVKSDSFNPLITEIRKLYQSFVSEYSLIGLLNLYRYEMILIEDLLLGYINKVFIKIRYSDDPVLESRINESLSEDPKWQRLELIQRKLAILQPIKS